MYLWLIQNGWKVFKYLFAINPNKPLYSNTVFWIASFIPLCFAGYLAFPLQEGLELSLTTKGYKLFSEVFQFPLWICTGSLIMGVMVGRFHGSSQRALMIETGNAQNHFSNFFKHREVFFEYLDDKWRNGKNELLIDSTRIYINVFPKNTINNNTTVPDESAISKIDDIYNESLERLYFIENNDSSIKKINLYEDQLEFFLGNVGVLPSSSNIPDYDQEYIHRRFSLLKSVYKDAVQFGATGLSLSDSILIKLDEISHKFIDALNESIDRMEVEL